jgi:predicted enzyme related to lactoylglutathione lyase
MDHGSFYWNELMTHDVEKAKAFYAAAIGWSFEGMPMPDIGTYWVAQQDGRAVGGIMAMVADVPAGTPSHWLCYLAVDDIDARLREVAAAGGQICRPAFDVPGVGRIAIVADPTGAVMGWITPTPAPAG